MSCLRQRSVQTAPLAAIFSGPCADGIARVAALGQRVLGLDHPRSGEIVLVASADRWFAADWWADPNERPSGLTTGSGLSRPKAGGPLPIDQVRGSLGAGSRSRLSWCCRRIPAFAETPRRRASGHGIRRLDRVGMRDRPKPPNYEAGGRAVMITMLIKMVVTSPQDGV